MNDEKILYCSPDPKRESKIFCFQYKFGSSVPEGTKRVREAILVTLFNIGNDTIIRVKQGFGDESFYPLNNMVYFSMEDEELEEEEEDAT